MQQFPLRQLCDQSIITEKNYSTFRQKCKGTSAAPLGCTQTPSPTFRRRIAARKFSKWPRGYEQNNVLPVAQTIRFSVTRRHHRHRRRRYRCGCEEPTVLCLPVPSWQLTRTLTAPFGSSVQAVAISRHQRIVHRTRRNAQTLHWGEKEAGQPHRVARVRRYFHAGPSAQAPHVSCSATGCSDAIPHAGRNELPASELGPAGLNQADAQSIDGPATRQRPRRHTLPP